MADCMSDKLVAACLPGGWHADCNSSACTAVTGGCLAAAQAHGGSTAQEWVTCRLQAASTHCSVWGLPDGRCCSSQCFLRVGCSPAVPLHMSSVGQITRKLLQPASTTSKRVNRATFAQHLWKQQMATNMPIVLLAVKRWLPHRSNEAAGRQQLLLVTIKPVLMHIFI